METQKIQFTLRELSDIKFALILAAYDCRDNAESALADDMLALYDRLNEYLTPYGY